MMDGQERITVTFHDQLYDVTSFAQLHPGGANLLQHSDGKEICSLLSGSEALDGKSHRHSASAYRILRDYAVLRTIPTATNSLIDTSRPVVEQIAALKDRYWSWIHEPTCESLRLFHSAGWESLSRTKWYAVPLVWMPIIVLLNVGGWNDFRSEGNGYFTSLQWFVTTFLCGIFCWTLMEYVIHRYGFHWQPSSNSPRLMAFHFILHGLHHKTPMDKDRLVFPPAIASLIVVLLFWLYKACMPWSRCLIFSSGNLFGYICYDMMHYYLHHGEPAPGTYLHRLKKYHYNHHFNNQHQAYGISSAIWDNVFGTVGSYQ
uniref:Cytochrome b5 heme-binding domain-containing protein n=1 Tax=Trichuris muris TaxID=70415 RepID=A0A5S6QAX7_TRIMR